MKINIFKAKSLNYLLILILIPFFLTSCNALKPKKVDLRKIPGNPADKRQKNIQEGRGFRVMGALEGRKGSGNFQFASSNEMWRASLELLEFTPLSNVDYSGGVIITDWFSENSDQDPIKITVRFLSNEIRADGLKVVVYDRLCQDQNLLNCQTTINESEVSEEIKFAILKKASSIKNLELDVKVKEYRKKNPGTYGTLK